MRKFSPISSPQLGQIGDLVERERQKLLPAKPRIHAHHQHIMHHRQHFDQRIHRRRRIDDHPRQHPMLLNQLQRPVQMPADLLLHAQHVRARLGKRRNKRVGILDHQVAVQRQLRDRAQRLAPSAAQR